MKRETNGGRAFTLVEVVVAAACMCLLSISLMQLFQTGTRSSRQGLVKIETTLEARRILNQVVLDVNLACFPAELKDDPEAGKLSPASIITYAGNEQAFSYSWYRFPTQGSVADFLGTSGTINPASTEKVRRRISRVCYSLERLSDPGRPFYRLTRLETFHPSHPLAKTFPEGRKSVLSERVNYFALTPETHTFEDGVKTAADETWAKQPFFRISLMIAELVQKDPAGLDSPEQWKTPAAGVVIADFFEVAYAEFCNQLIARGWEKRNWYQVLDFPK